LHLVKEPPPAVASGHSRFVITSVMLYFPASLILQRKVER